MITISNCLKEGIDFLKKSEIPDPEISASLLLSSILEQPELAIHLEANQQLDLGQAGQYQKLLQKRAERYPLQYLLRTIPFRNVILEIGEDCLIPRPETELLVETVLNTLNRQESLEILDIGTGSGNIAISLAQESPRWTLKATDLSSRALVYARKNAKLNHVSIQIDFSQANLFTEGQFDAIVSNPPYLKTIDLEQAQQELHFEPKTALCGGEDGLDFYRNIIPNAKHYLKKEGFIFFEIGYDQAVGVSKLLAENHFHSIQIVKDYAGLDRIITGRLA